jgi:hypothetical protein
VATESDKRYLTDKIRNLYNDFSGVHIILVKGKGKVKGLPVQAWTGPDGFRRSWLPDFKTIGS